MSAVFDRAYVYKDGSFVFKKNVLLDGVFINSENKIFSNDIYIFPGFVDVHVHLREPGFSFKETVLTGSAAAANGGFTAVCTMPNLSPVPDCKQNLQKQLDIIKRDGKIQIIPFGSITVGQAGKELSDMEGMAPFVAGFSDDGRGVQSKEIMRAAMERAKALDKVISAHCEDMSLVGKGYIHDGEYARAHGHAGIASESEWRQIARDIELCAATGCAYHVCHVSAKESVELIRQAKKSGVNVTCETAPHYLTLTDGDLQEDGRFKMNPPLRSADDRDALIEGLRDGTVDMIATDHAPHTAEEKSRGLRDSLMGIVGLETAFPVLYTGLVKTGKISLERLVEAMSIAPAKRFGIDNTGCFTVFDLNESYVIDSGDFLSMGRATPFEGTEVYGKRISTVYKGEEI